MLIFRIEHIFSGQGVYNSGGAVRYDFVRDIGKHPSVYDQAACPAPNMWSEPLLSNYWPFRDMHFAFQSLELLKRWFSCERGRAELAARDHWVKVVEVPDDRVVLGEFQCIYPVAAANAVRFLDVRTLEPMAGA